MLRVMSRSRVQIHRAAHVALVVALGATAGCQPPVDEPPAAVEPSTRPWLWRPGIPPDGLFERAESRLVMRLPRDAVEAAEELYGPPHAGAVAGWWIRPMAPRSTGAWMLLSTSGAIYAVIASPTRLPEAGKKPAFQAAQAWRTRLQAR